MITRGPIIPPNYMSGKTVKATWYENLFVLCIFAAFIVWAAVTAPFVKGEPKC